MEKGILPYPYCSSSGYLADLMMFASNEVEDAIIRLAQNAQLLYSVWFCDTTTKMSDVITGHY